MNENGIAALLLCILYYLSTFVSGHKLLFFKSCPSVTEMASFDVDQFLGKWYIIEIFSGVNRCMAMTFQKQSDSELTVTQTREFILLDKINIDYFNTYTGTLVIDDSNRKADMTVKWPQNILGSADFKIVDTDYKNYALIFDCQNLLMFSRVSFAILSREKTLDGETVNLLKQKIRDTGVNPSSLKVIDQVNCKETKVVNDTVEYVDDNAFALIDDSAIIDIADDKDMIDFLKWNVPTDKLKSDRILEAESVTEIKMNMSEAVPKNESKLDRQEEPEPKLQNEPEPEPQNEPEPGPAQESSPEFQKQTSKKN